MSDQSIDFQENAKATDRQSDASLMENSPEAVFCWNNARTAKHYVYSLLPRALSQTCAIQNCNHSPLLAKLELEIHP